MQRRAAGLGDAGATAQLDDVAGDRARILQDVLARDQADRVARAAGGDVAGELDVSQEVDADQAVVRAELAEAADIDGEAGIDQVDPGARGDRHRMGDDIAAVVRLPPASTVRAPVVLTWKPTSLLPLRWMSPPPLDVAQKLAKLSPTRLIAPVASAVVMKAETVPPLLVIAPLVVARIRLPVPVLTAPVSSILPSLPR